MGHGGWSDESYSTYRSIATSKTRDELFHKRSKSCESLSGQRVNVEDIACRESRDSESNPCSTPIIVGLDVTGSMGMIPEALVKEGLGQLVGQILERGPVPDPHICFLGIGDAFCDQAPLQATQFEADNCVCDQLTDIWLEGGGGGNHFESYDLAWAFAAYKTQTDAWDKRKDKGYLFTVGDEEFPQRSSATYMKQAFQNDGIQSPTPKSLLADAEQKYRVFHVVIEEGWYYSERNPEDVQNSWGQKLGNRVLFLDNHRHLPQLIVSAIAIDQGVPAEEVIEWWDGAVAESVSHAIDLTQTAC
jgi:hypothetical protein